jgi:hypothetical protein
VGAVREHACPLGQLTGAARHEQPPLPHAARRARHRGRTPTKQPETCPDTRTARGRTPQPRFQQIEGTSPALHAVFPRQTAPLHNPVPAAAAGRAAAARRVPMDPSSCCRGLSRTWLVQSSTCMQKDGRRHA